jgi:Xaa-Pro aminopeptidase
VLFEIWVCADGYWADHTKNLVVGELKPSTRSSRSTAGRLRARTHLCAPAQAMAEFDRSVRDDLARMGYPGQPSHPICHGIGARADRPIRTR